MTVAIWIIAICVWLIADCEIIRLVQNAQQLRMLAENHKGYDDACKAFVESLKDDDRERVRKLLEELDKAETATVGECLADVVGEYESGHELPEFEEDHMDCPRCGVPMVWGYAVSDTACGWYLDWRCPVCGIHKTAGAKESDRDDGQGGS